MSKDKLNEFKIVKVGIPRAMSYYYNFPFYYGFFKALGVEVVVSGKTTAKTINTGGKYVASETCLPVKVFVGHVVELLDKGVSNIFIPSLQSTAYKINNCSKIRGLPEIIRNVINRPFNMLEPTLDKTSGLGFKQFWFETAHLLGFSDKKLINSAIEEGWDCYNCFLEMAEAGLPYHIALENSISGVYERKYIRSVKAASVVVMAHGYNLFDEQLSKNLLKKLEEMGVQVYTSLNVSRQKSLDAINELGEFQYWANEPEITGVAAYYMLNGKIDGIIALSSFGCGPDSLMVEEIRYYAKDLEIPLLHLTMDEHTGEAGFVTRIEAFVDMIFRKKRLNNKEKIIKKTDIQETREKVLTY